MALLEWDLFTGVQLTGVPYVGRSKAETCLGCGQFEESTQTPREDVEVKKVLYIHTCIYTPEYPFVSLAECITYCWRGADA